MTKLMESGTKRGKPVTKAAIYLRRYRWFTRSIAAGVVGLALMGSGSASAANGSQQITKAQWKQAITQLRTPGQGCYHAAYPKVAWLKSECTVAPKMRFQPATVGNGDDWATVTSGKLSQVQGEFQYVSPGISESGPLNNSGPLLPNTYSLQINSQFFNDPPKCSGAATPSNCDGWEQFVYSSDGNSIFIQYWLIDYATTCPSGWNTYGSDCWTNGNAATYVGGTIPASEFHELYFVGFATSGGNDTVELGTEANGEYGATAVSTAESTNSLDLANYWNTAEFNVVGDAGGGQATFSAGSTLWVQTLLVGDTSESAPSCVIAGTTGETNNLNLVRTHYEPGSYNYPISVFKETNDSSTVINPPSATCSSAPGP